MKADKIGAGFATFFEIDVMSKSDIPRQLVIYADDDRDDLDLMKESFLKYANNLELVCFEDGNSALNYLKACNDSDPCPCLIILDINLPGITGKTMLKELRSMDKFRTVPIILFTTSSQPHDKSFAGKYNAGFMTKPLNYTQMDKISEEFIGHCADEVRKKLEVDKEG
jgi:CheY-like chemotaxis protein